LATANKQNFSLIKNTLESFSLLSRHLLKTGHLLVITSELTTVLVVILLVLLFISFCVSGAEIAFFSLTFRDINHLKTKQQHPYKRVISLLEQPKLLLGTLMIANSFANIGVIIISNFLINQWLPIQNDLLHFGVKLLIVASVILLFVEMLPKTFASQNNIRFAKDVAWLVEGSFLLFKGLAARLVGFSDGVE
jgi:Mg2+/Co2+ transporter CorB